jgi:hypothetical protein
MIDEDNDGKQSSDFLYERDVPLKIVYVNTLHNEINHTYDPIYNFIYDAIGNPIQLSRHIPENQKGSIDFETLQENYEVNKNIKFHEVELTPEYCIQNLQNNGLLLQYIKYQTPEIVDCALNNDIKSFPYAKIYSQQNCLLAVAYNGEYIKYILNPTEEICERAINNNCSVLNLIKNQSDNICIKAVKKMVIYYNLSNNKQKTFV